jgi:hypothetical protein
MSSALATREQNSGQIVEDVVIKGDLSSLQAGDRADYYSAVCRSVGLNPLTKPFDYITLNGKLTLYARKDATDQLRKIHNVSVVIVAREWLDAGIYVVTAQATTPNGRTDESVGAVNVANLKGDNLANAIMKAETKSKRRVTLSICGLGWLDETEVDSIPDAQRVRVDDDGVIEGETKAPSSPLAAPTPTNGNGHAKQEPEWATPDAIMQLVDAYRQWRPRDKRQNEALVDAVLWSACESKARTAANVQAALAAVKAWQFEEMESQAADAMAAEPA